MKNHMILILFSAEPSNAPQQGYFSFFAAVHEYRLLCKTQAASHGRSSRPFGTTLIFCKLLRPNQHRASRALLVMKRSESMTLRGRNVRGIVLKRFDLSALVYCNFRNGHISFCRNRGTNEMHWKREGSFCVSIA
jgi:hypothetical protein